MKFSINQEHLLVNSETSVEYLTEKTKVKNNKTYKQYGGVLDTLIIHYTAGSSAESSSRFLARPEVKASAHLVIGRDGEVFQLVPFDKVAWHVGRSSYGGRTGYNKYSIGIELDNAGFLKKAGSMYQANFGKKYPESDVIKVIHKNETRPRYWHTYTEKQIATLLEITTLLIEKYDLKDVLGHDDISPGRKQDPGPAFDMKYFRQRVMGQDRSDDGGIDDIPETGKVYVNKLNIRSGPGSNFDKIAKPLRKDKEVKILREEDGWYEVETTIKGWVSKGYIDTKS